MIKGILHKVAVVLACFFFAVHLCLLFGTENSFDFETFITFLLFSLMAYGLFLYIILSLYISAQRQNTVNLPIMITSYVIYFIVHVYFICAYINNFKSNNGVFSNEFSGTTGVFVMLASFIISVLLCLIYIFTRNKEKVEGAKDISSKNNNKNVVAVIYNIATVAVISIFALTIIMWIVIVCRTAIDYDKFDFLDALVNCVPYILALISAVIIWVIAAIIKKVANNSINKSGQ